MDGPILTLRQFNRSYTQRIGVLDESFLGSGRPLGPSRVLYEVGPNGTTARELRDRLGLDSGHLSRLLRRLEDDGVVEVTPDPADRRRRCVRLTARGRREWRRLDRRSDELAERILTPLSERQRVALVGALDTAERILRAATLRIEPLDPDDVRAIAALAAYFDELDRRFPTGFDPGDALSAGLGEFRPPSGAFVAALDDGQVAACGAIQRVDDRTAEIKRMWVRPGWRGHGVGRRMLHALEARCRTLGYERVVLDTNAELAEAIQMYTTAGYTPTERYSDNPYAQRWFEKEIGSERYAPPGPHRAVRRTV